MTNQDEQTKDQKEAEHKAKDLVDKKNEISDKKEEKHHEHKTKTHDEKEPKEYKIKEPKIEEHKQVEVKEVKHDDEISKDKQTYFEVRNEEVEKEMKGKNFEVEFPTGKIETSAPNQNKETGHEHFHGTFTLHKKKHRFLKVLLILILLFAALSSTGYFTKDY